MHPSPHELLELLSEAKRLEWGSEEQLRLLERLRTQCPAHVPGLLLSSRALLWGKEDLADPATFFAEVEQLLLGAVDASDRTPEALIGLARFKSVVRDAPLEAEALYREAATRALTVLEEAWAGLIESLGEQGKTEGAATTATLARTLFPDSSALAEARKFAGLKD
ncbi:hypothetical protein HUA74_31165 [Myxococcus sp. CA051A]|uniref:hypothetical protein n=1 Tax=unclassified Myxococcus TaxID=2648731 RepID=UPI00157A7094|nr:MULTISPECIES: hypothetical protein [unclassified Myxococcus]NTX09799.1 hypothetical protein [Myxococcus sp. CA056]NTX65126.1 hypothetical protein [Myxococcus sp. CA051A]